MKIGSFSLSAPSDRLLHAWSPVFTAHDEPRHSEALVVSKTARVTHTHTHTHTHNITEQLEQDRVYPCGPLYSLGCLLSRGSLP